MVVAKWVIVAFLGVTAIFAGDLRAQQAPPRQTALDRLVASGKLTGNMAAHLASINQNLGVDLDVSDWLIAEKKFDVERTLANLDSSAFYQLYPHLLEKCAISVKSIKLGTSIYLSGGDLNVDISDAGILARLENLPERCEKIAAALRDANAAAAPRTVSINSDRIYTGGISAAAISKWASAIRSTRFIPTLEDFSRNCKVTVSEIRLDTYSNFSSSNSQRTFDIGAGAADATQRLSFAANGCAIASPALAELNTKYSIAGYGLLFAVDSQQFYDRRFSGAQILAWIKFLQDDTARIGKLKAAIIKGSRDLDFTELKSCLADASKQPRQCNKYVIEVNFTDYSRIAHMGAFGTLFLLVLGDPFIIATMAGIDGIINGPVVNLDGSHTPFVPALIK